LVHFKNVTGDLLTVSVTHNEAVWVSSAVHGDGKRRCAGIGAFSVAGQRGSHFYKKSRAMNLLQSVSAVNRLVMRISLIASDAEQSHSEN